MFSRSRRLFLDPTSQPGIRPTVNGYRFILVTFLLGVAAVNTGNNLIYLVLAMIAAMVIVSYLVVWPNLRGLTLSIDAPQPVFAGKKTGLNFTIGKIPGRPSFDIQVRMDSPGSSITGVGYIRGGTSRTCATTITPNKRGPLSIEGILMASGFPFGLITCTTRKKTRKAVLVYPKMIDLEDLLPSPLEMSGGISKSLSGSGEEYLLSREYREGDSLRNIHWKASARTSRLMVKEFSREEPSRITILLSNTGPWEESLFERAVSITASLASVLIGQGFHVCLRTHGKATGFGRSRAHLFKILDVLALTSVEAEDAEVLPRESRSDYSIAVTNRTKTRAEISGFDRVFYADETV